MNAAAVWAVWIVLMVVGAVWAENRAGRPAPDEVVASRALPRNTLLLPGQLAPVAFSMSYVVRPGGVPARGHLTLADVASEPVLAPIPADSVLANAPAEWSAVSDGLNAGSTVTLCRGSTPVLASANVQAVLCAPVQGAQRCTAVIAVPLAARDALDALGKSSPLHLANSC